MYISYKLEEKIIWSSTYFKLKYLLEISQKSSYLPTIYIHQVWEHRNSEKTCLKPAFLNFWCKNAKDTNRFWRGLSPLASLASTKTHKKVSEHETRWLCPKGLQAHHCIEHIKTHRGLKPYKIAFQFPYCKVVGRSMTRRGCQYYLYYLAGIICLPWLI